MIDRIVIIGMPCSGKSSIGRSAAQTLGYRFLDMDEIIEKKAGMSVNDFFNKYGEAVFRKMETALCQKLATMHKVLISTGGGVVMRQNNMEILAKDSYVIFLHRNFIKLASTPKRITDKRPVLKEKSTDDLLEMYEQRLPLYKKYSNIEIPNDKNKMDAYELIVRAVNKENAKDDTQNENIDN